MLTKKTAKTKQFLQFLNFNLINKLIYIIKPLYYAML